ncbi:N-acyl-D-amino-acid deacylase family protein [Arthrobacter psychrochitiniphilus]|uniref:N-acyl-D-amino-acid deacylase family protein n=1 Tax=Arthrobacter psychrochitiniphilus TaxID=291045 RepID=UPI003F7B5CFD
MTHTAPTPPPHRTILRGGTLLGGADSGGTAFDGGHSGPRVADVVLVNGRIESIGQAVQLPGDVVVECAGRLVLPGFVDAHSHADAVIFDPAVQLALLRQGITTVIGGQDGVSFAPGDGRYASSYFAAINGTHPSFSGGGVAELLACYERATPLNFAYLIPAGTVRWEVMGRSTAAPTAEQLDQMCQLVEQGLAEGAVGLSSGLDYVPGMFADAAEISQLCVLVAKAGAIYVTHMRGGYEANSSVGVEEILAISVASGVKAHISHFHATAPIISAMLGELAGKGVDATFDSYPYTRGCSLLSMPMLPPELSVKPVEEIMAALSSPEQRAAIIADWFPAVSRNASLGSEWPTMMTLGHIAAPEFQWAHGLTLAGAAENAGQGVADFTLDVLLHSRLEVNVIMAVRYQRDMAELGTIMSSPLHLGGSDGIFIGAHPHPRAAGSFTKYLRTLVREQQIWTWDQAVQHLSTGACERFGLGQRGRIAPGWVADVILVDPEKVCDTANYQNPAQLAVGIDDVFVSGVHVLTNGTLTGALPGKAVQRSAAVQ